MTTMPGNDADRTPPHTTGSMLATWLAREPGRELSGTVQEVTDRNGTITSLGPSHTYRIGAVLGQGGQAAVAAATPLGAPDRGPLVARVELNPRDPRDWRRRELLLFLAHLSRVTPATYPALIRVTESFVTYAHSSELHGQPRFDSHAGNEPLWVDVMERCTTLADHMKATHPNGYDPLEGAKLAVPLLRTLGVLHDRYRLVHRDIDEGNVLVAPDATLRIADWGVVVPMSGSNPYTYTVTFGKRATMPPENRDGDQKVGHHTDAWQAGRLLGLILTGASPFLNDGTTLNSPRLASLPRELRAIIEGLTSPHVGARLTTYDAANQLEKYIGHPITATATRPPIHRLRNSLVGVGVAAMVIGGAAVGADRVGLFETPATTPTATSTPSTTTSSTAAAVDVAREPLPLQYYPTTPSVAWDLTLEHLGLDSSEGASLGDPTALTIFSEGWSPTASLLDAGHTWITAVREVGDAPWQLLGLAPETGEVEWTYTPGQDGLYLIVCAGPLLDGDLACLAQSKDRQGEASPAEVLLIDTTTGSEDDRFTLPAYSRTLTAAGSDLLVLTATEVAGASHEVARYSRDGELIWSTPIVTAGDGASETDVLMERLEVGGSLVMADVNGATRVLDLENGTVLVDRGTSQGYCWGTEGDFTFRKDGSLVLTHVNSYDVASVDILDTTGRVTATLPQHQLARSLTVEESTATVLRNPDGDYVALADNGIVTPVGVRSASSSASPSACSGEGIYDNRVSLVDDHIFIRDSGTGLSAFSQWESGKLLWEQPYVIAGQLLSDAENLYGFLADGNYVPTYLVAINKADGSTQWTLPAPGVDNPAIQNVQGHLVTNSPSAITVLTP